MKIDEYLDQYIHIHADCIPVRGHKRAAFYDLTRNEIVLFPSVYYDVLGLFKTKTLGALLDETETEEQKDLFIAFLQFLMQHEFIIFLDEPSLAMFPPIEDSWDMPCAIQNAIIDVDEVCHDFEKVFGELDYLGCEYIQLRSFSNMLTINDLDSILSLLYHTSMQRIELILTYDEAIPDEQYVALFEKHPVISSIYIHSAPVEKNIKVDFGYDEAFRDDFGREIYFITEKIDSHSHCGLINIASFSAPSVSSFFENKRHNGCLNRKISIDVHGDIRNCPSMPVNYGNSKDTSLTDIVLNRKDFQEVWHINKDQIAVCKDCEFRYICTDCRAYVEEPDNMYSKPLKCGYDPYTAKWEEWSRNPLKQKAMIHYGLG